MTKLPAPPPETLRSLELITAERYPRGYFDALRPATALLLDKGFNLGKTADILIAKGSLPANDRAGYMSAMRQRFHRLRRKRAASLTGLAWRKSPFLDMPHIVSADGKSLCGANSSSWLPWCEEDGGYPCRRCKGQMKTSPLAAPQTQR